MFRDCRHGIGTQAGRRGRLRLARREPHDRLHCLEGAHAPRPPGAVERLVPVGHFRAGPQEVVAEATQLLFAYLRGIEGERREQARASVGVPSRRASRDSDVPDALLD